MVLGARSIARQVRLNTPPVAHKCDEPSPAWHARNLQAGLDRRRAVEATRIRELARAGFAARSKAVVALR